MRPDSLAVIGLGPVGGSLAWAAVGAGVPRVVGYARDRGDAVQALTAGAVHELSDRPELAVQDADLVVIDLASGAEHLARITPHLRPGAFVTTVADLVVPLLPAVHAAGLTTRWAASHPLVRPLGSGFGAARPAPFRGGVVYVSPASPEGDEAAREVIHFWEDLVGAEGVRVAAEEHDRRAGWMEQLPRLLAAAASAGYGANGLGATSWGREARMLTDLIAEDPSALARMLLANRTNVQEGLVATSGILARYAAAIGAGDEAGLAALIDDARRIRRGSER